jgi:hypothetical protein
MDMTETDETEWPPHLEALVAAPANHRLLHEDDEVRVLEVTVQPGERENLHHHRWPSIMVVLARPDYRSFDAEGNEIPPSLATLAARLTTARHKGLPQWHRLTASQPYDTRLRICGCDPFDNDTYQVTIMTSAG